MEGIGRLGVVTAGLALAVLVLLNVAPLVGYEATVQRPNTEDTEQFMNGIWGAQDPSWSPSGRYDEGLLTMAGPTIVLATLVLGAGLFFLLRQRMNLSMGLVGGALLLLLLCMPLLADAEDDAARSCENWDHGYADAEGISCTGLAASGWMLLFFSQGLVVLTLLFAFLGRRNEAVTAISELQN